MQKESMENPIDLFLVPAVGLEPTRGYPQQILSLHRLPFRHAGKYGSCGHPQLLSLAHQLPLFKNKNNSLT